MSLEGEFVLVVDDSPDTLSMLNEALESAGFTVLVALEGKQALTIARKIKPAVILLDAVMPVLNGFETCAALKADQSIADIPVIFMTGLSDTESIVKGLEAGGVDFLSKPINPDELVARVKVHLATAKLTSSAQHALDATGQLLFTVNKNGELLWATPGSKALFSKSGAGAEWLSTELSSQLRTWFSHKPNSGQSLKLENLPSPLEIQVLDTDQDGESLLKLIDSNEPTGIELLRLKLPLTDRESEVLYWLAHGKTNREIAQIIDLSPRTINKHLEPVFRKLEVDNRTAAAAIAIKLLTQGH